jgi:Spy/CpxP family protein refolding chaperone
VALVLVWVGASLGADPAPPIKAAPDKPNAAPKLGLLLNDTRALQGYTLLNPMMSTTTYLIDLQGHVVRSWKSDCTPALSAYLLENGHLLRPGNQRQQSFGNGLPGTGGRIQEFDWDGHVVWDFQFFSDKQLPHHDLTPLPNGNVLLIVYDKKTAKEALAAGRRPELVGDRPLYVDSLVEIKPTGKTTGQVVWEWHLWDHLVQDRDKSKANYGNVAEHPELVDANYGEDQLAPILAQKGGADKLKSIGYVGNAPPPGNRPPRMNSDWTHFNAVAYNPELDQIVVSVHAFSEIWVIDHGTTTAEAGSHQGGRSGKGGDLLYRWGNPRAYRGGTKADQRLFAQHSAHWIARGLPGEGHLMVFNNGGGRPDGSYSSVDEIVPPVDVEGHYLRKPGTAFGPDKPVWSYSAPKKSDFFSMLISGAQRLPNGNTLICSGINGTLFEVTPEKETVWKYVNPTKGGFGPGGFGAPPQPGQVLPSFLQDMLRLSSEQKKEVSELQKEIDGRLDKLLTAEQKKQFKEPRPMFGPGAGPPPQAGQIMAASLQDTLKLSAEQRKDLGEVQKHVDARFDKILKDEQKKQLKDMQRGFGFMAGGPGGFRPPGGGSPQPGQLLPPPIEDRLRLSDDQKKQVHTIQKEVDEKLAQLLTDEQKKQLKEPRGPGRGGFGGPPQAGQILELSVQIRLKMTPDQRKEMQELQKRADQTLAQVLNDEQKKQLKETRQGFGRGGPGGGPGFGGPGGPPGFGPPGGPGGPPGFGGPGGGSVFRAYRYAASYPGLAGKDLTPGKTVEELESKETQKK